LGGRGATICGEVVRELGGEAALRRGLPRQLLQAVGAALDQEVAFRHRFAGGGSPVARRQIFDAVRRAAIVAPAAKPA